MPVASPFPDVEIPDVTLYDLLFGDIAEADLDRVAVVDGPTGDELTYRQVVGAIDAIAGAYAARGVRPGDVVGLLAPNTPAYVLVFHGLLRAGATVTTINALYPADDVAKQLRAAGATRLVSVSPLLEAAEGGARQVGIADSDHVVLDGAEGHESLTDLIAEGRPAPDLAIDPSTHLAALPFSSGTTSEPKGVALTHRNLVANVVQAQKLLGEEADDVVLAVLPFFHIYGMTVLLNLSMYNRASLVTMPRFDLPEFLRLTAERRCTYLFIAPPVAVALAKHPLIDQYDLSSVHTILSGAAPLDRELGEAVARRLDCRVRQGYGMSELSPVSHAIPLDWPYVDLGSCGPAIPNVRVKLVDPATDEEVAYPEPGTDERSAPGEVWVAGPNVMRGYLNNEAATRDTIDEDGYLHTGDIGELDGHGNLYIVDRLKELIKYKGYQVPPAELEAVLLTHPKIADAAVIGVRDEDGEEIPKAFVVLQDGAELSADEVMEYVGGKVAPHKKVRRVEFIGLVPKSSSGKILRRELRTGGA